MEGATLSDANLTNSYFSSSFIGVNGFGSPAESKYSMMQVKMVKDTYNQSNHSVTNVSVLIAVSVISRLGHICTVKCFLQHISSCDCFL